MSTSPNSFLDLSPVSPNFPSAIPCINDLLPAVSDAFANDACVPLLHYLLENHPDDGMYDTCLRSCSRFLRSDMESIQKLNTSLPFGWSLVSAPSSASMIHRRRQEKRARDLRQRCQVFVDKIQKRFANPDGSDGAMTLLFLHLINQKSDRIELRQSVRSLFQWHQDLCLEFEGFIKDTALERLNENDDGTRSVMKSTPCFPRSLSPASSQTSEETIYPSLSDALSTPKAIASALLPSDSPKGTTATRPAISDNSWLPTLISTPPASSLSALVPYEPMLHNVAMDCSDESNNKLGLSMGDATVSKSPRTFMDQHLARKPSPRLPPSVLENNSQQRQQPSPEINDDQPLHGDIFLTSRVNSFSDPNILPSYASLDKDLSSVVQPTTYEPVLFPFNVTHGRTIHFENPAPAGTSVNPQSLITSDNAAEPLSYAKAVTRGGGTGPTTKAPKPPKTTTGAEDPWQVKVKFLSRDSVKQPSGRKTFKVKKAPALARSLRGVGGQPGEIVIRRAGSREDLLLRGDSGTGACPFGAIGDGRPRTVVA